MSLHRKLNVKIFLMFIVAENTGSVNITVCVRKVNIMPEVYPSGGGFPNIERPGPNNPWY